MVVTPKCLGKFLLKFLLQNLETAEGNSSVKLCTDAHCRLAGNWGLNDALKRTTEFGYVHKMFDVILTSNQGSCGLSHSSHWHLVNMVEKGSVLLFAIGLLNLHEITSVSTGN